MSVVVGVVGAHVVALGADGAQGHSSGLVWPHGGEHKLATVNDAEGNVLVAWASCGAARLANELQELPWAERLDELRAPSSHGAVRALRSLVVGLLGRLRERDSCYRDDEGAELPGGGGFLVALPSGLYDVDSGGAVSIVPWRANGSGAQVAAGAVYALLPVEPDPAVVVRRALAAAEQLTPWCGGTLRVVSVKRA